ncbi:MAG: NRDE family protein [Candidatus Hydrogenedentes bacterium]|nr:NRDE family protein [Candidatus Hydrogenedentota bacterium]
MCTVSIHRGHDSYRVTMNRDESKSRAAEWPPRVFEGAGHRWICPGDGERGGTWFAVNECGVTGCITNGPMPLDRLPEFMGADVPSRGSILPALMPLGSLEAMELRLRTRFSVEELPPFCLVLTDQQRSLVASWTIEGAWAVEETRQEWFMISSSLWHTREVDIFRHRVFAEWIEGGAVMAGELPAFHVHFDPQWPEFSPRMEREWSCTRSITQATVRAGKRTLVHYLPLKTWEQPGEPEVYTL